MRAAAAPSARAHRRAALAAAGRRAARRLRRRGGAGQPDALRRLERRVDVLEQMVRRLLASGTATERITPAPEPPAVAPPAAPIPRRHEPRSYSPPPAAAPDLEQWFGQRGLLIVGVLALLTATGFFLKYAI